MSKYDPLWEYVRENGPRELTFDEIHSITGVPIDHSFLNCKQELPEYGYEVERISMKARTVRFRRLEGQDNGL